MELTWQDPGVDAFYKVVLRHWQHLLPDLAKVPKVVLIDLSEMTEASPNAKRVKREIIEIVKIEDDDEENEEEQFKKLPETSLTLDEINEKIEYLRWLVVEICIYRNTTRMCQLS